MSLQRPPRARLDAVTVYLIITGATALFGSTIFTLAAIYRVQEAGLTPLQLVLVGTVMEASIFLFEVPTGVVADTFGRRASVITGIALLGAASVLEGAVPLFGSILLAQALWGLGYTFTSGATEAWISGEVEAAPGSPGAAEVGRVFLRGAQVGQVAGLAGIGLSVLLASVRLNLPLIVGGALTVALALFLVGAMPETGFQRRGNGSAAPGEGGENAWRQMERTLREGAGAVRGRPVLLLIIAVAAFQGMSTEGIDRLWEAHLLSNVRFPAVPQLPVVAWFGVVSAGSALLGIGGMEVVRRRVDTSDPRAVTRALFGLYGLRIVGTVVFGFAGGFPLAVAAFWGASLTRRVSNPIYSAWLTQHIEPRVRATVISMSGQVDAISQVIGGPILGAIGEVSLRAAMVAGALALAPALWLVALAGRAHPARPLTPRP